MSKVEVKEPDKPLYRHLVRGDFFRMCEGGQPYIKTGTRAVNLTDGTEKSVAQETTVVAIPPGTVITIAIGDDNDGT